MNVTKTTQKVNHATQNVCIYFASFQVKLCGVSSVDLIVAGAGMVQKTWEAK